MNKTQVNTVLNPLNQDQKVRELVKDSLDRFMQVEQVCRDKHNILSMDQAKTLTNTFLLSCNLIKLTQRDTKAILEETVQRDLQKRVQGNYKLHQLGLFPFLFKEDIQNESVFRSSNLSQFIMFGGLCYLNFVKRIKSSTILIPLFFTNLLLSYIQMTNYERYTQDQIEKYRSYWDVPNDKWIMIFKQELNGEPYDDQILNEYEKYEYEENTLNNKDIDF